LASGYGLVFNPGEHVEGYSNFLWTVLMALPARLGVSEWDLGMIITAKVLGSVLSVATIALLWKTSSYYLPAADRPAAQIRWTAPLFLACSGVFGAWSVGGLETPLVTFLILLSILLYLRHDTDDGAKFPLTLSSSCLAMAALTRPEPVVMFLGIAAFRLADHVRGRAPIAKLRQEAL